MKRRGKNFELVKKNRKARPPHGEQVNNDGSPEILRRRGQPGRPGFNGNVACERCSLVGRRMPNFCERDEVALAEAFCSTYRRSIRLDFGFHHLVDGRCLRILAVANDCTGICLELEFVVTASRRGMRLKTMPYVMGS